MNDNVLYPPYDAQANDSSNVSLDASERARRARQRTEWLTGADYPPPDTRALYAPSYNPHGPALDEYYHHAALPQEIPKRHGPDEVLSPLPLGGMQGLHEYHDRVTPPTPPIPEPSFPLSQLAYGGTRTSITSSQSSSSLPYSPYSPVHLSFPGSYDSPSLHVPSLYPSPSQHSQHSLPGYMASPVVGTPSTYYSFYDSPAASSVTNYHSLPTSPALQIDSTFASPAQVGPSALPNVPGLPFQLPPTPSRPLAPFAVARKPVPQANRVKSNSPLTEHFTVDGAPGVSVLGVVKKSVTVDGPNERVLEAIYMRHIHVVVSWPGYEPKGIYLKLSRSGGHTTRRELVDRLCSRLAAIMKKLAGIERQRPKHSFSPHSQWAVGGNGMTIDNLWLLSIGPQADGSTHWAVELEVNE